MAKAKSVTQRFAQSVKRIARKAAKTTMKVLEPDKRSAKSRRRVVYPLAADGFVSDPMLFEPMPARPAKTRAAKTGRRTRKPARKAAKKTSSRRAAVAKKRSRAR
jgi:hypothetical protein